MGLTTDRQLSLQRAYSPINDLDRFSEFFCRRQSSPKSNAWISNHLRLDEAVIDINNLDTHRDHSAMDQWLSFVSGVFVVINTPLTLL